MKRWIFVLAIVLSLVSVAWVADRLQGLWTGVSRLALSVAEGHAPQPGEPSQPTTGDQVGQEGKRTQLLAERAELTAQIAAYDDEIRRIQAEAAAARERADELRQMQRERAKDASYLHLWSFSEVNSGYAQGLSQNIRALMQQRLEAQRRLIQLDQELEEGQGVSTGASRMDQRIAQSRPAAPTPPLQQPGQPPPSAEPAKPPPFSPLPPGPSPPAGRAAERGIALLQALREAPQGDPNPGRQGGLYTYARPQGHSNVDSHVTTWQYSGHAEDRGGSFCIPPGWVAHYSPDHLILRLTSPDGYALAERGLLGDPRRGLPELLSEEAVATSALQHYNLDLPNSRLLKEDKWEKRAAGTNLPLRQVARTACRGAPLQDKFGRVTPPAVPPYEFVRELNRIVQPQYLVRTIFRTLQAGDYTVAIFAESLTMDFGRAIHFHERSIRDYHLSSYVAVIAPTDRFTALTEEVFIPLLHLVWFSW